ncbi:cytochrome P450 2U1 [Biomphalaria pfeifferi]|uniref:Cytochrome P450 2U1 n=1 Tax=Biomphalaria pfeifferi TaxID=112525 RepID=A0AAD8B391_BIOPF|nr:cytochrome P450 2U1 [Biomphalaria pfeifferi]
MSRGKLKPEDERCIQTNYVYLKENLNALDIVDYLYQHSVITLDDKENISKPGLSRPDRNEVLLSTLLNAGPGDAFKYFLASLSKQYLHVLKKVQNKEGRTVDSGEQQTQSLLDKLADKDRIIANLKDENESLKIDLSTSKMEIEKLTKDLKTTNEDLKYQKSENAKLLGQLAKALKNVDSLKEQLKNGRSATDEFQLLSGDGMKTTVFGKHDLEILSKSNADVQEEATGCLKHAGHTGSIPNETFSINDLPAGYRHELVYKCIKSLADLTVRIAVSTTSVDRPEFIPGTTCPYYFSDTRGQSVTRTGTGFVVNTVMLDCTNKSLNACSCTKCLQSETRSKRFWRVRVITHPALVYDTTEARHTTVRLFYDKNDSPGFILDNCVDFQVKDETNLLEFDTCDIDNCLNLGRKCKEFIKYREHTSNYLVNKNHDTIFIVSHPHGNVKRVSFGKLQFSSSIDEYFSKIVYTGETCPGSTGAPVYQIGKENIRIHQGTSLNGLNYSKSFIHYRGNGRSQSASDCLLS